MRAWEKKTYRICRTCGRTYNVPTPDPYGKVYYCPPCDAYRKRQEREKKGGEQKETR